MEENTQDDRWNSIVDEFQSSGEPLEIWAKDHGVHQGMLKLKLKGYQEKNQKPKNRTSKEWDAIIKKQVASGKSVREWCQENNINEHAMTSAVGRRRAAEKKRNNSGKGLSAKTPTFVKAVSNAEPQEEKDIQIHVDSEKKVVIVVGGIVIEVNSDCPTEMLSAVCRGVTR
jgi:hypothetical protein